MSHLRAFVGLLGLGAMLLGSSVAEANAPLNLIKTMFPLVVAPGDTVTICLNVTQPATQPQADITWVLDITASMGGIISSIQANINAFTTQLSTQGINYQQGLYTFDDHQPEPDVNYGFASSDAQFQGFLSTAAGLVNNGGDLPENGLDALDEAAAGMPWRPAASHTLILVTDAPVHAQGFDNLSPLTLTAEAAALKAQGFVVDVISSTDANLLMQYGGNPANFPGPLALGDPNLIPGLADGQWLDIHSPGSAWNVFLNGLGGSIGSYSNVVLSDPLPPQLQPLPSASDGATITGNTLSWTVSNLAQGQAISHCVLALVNGGYYGAVTNTANVDADGTTATGTTASPIYYVTYTSTVTPTSTLTPSPTVTVSRTITQTFTITPTFSVTPTYTPTPQPLTLTLLSANPSPANTEVWLPFVLGTDANVDLQVWTVAGEPVRSWSLPGLLQAGAHETAWDLRNDSGQGVASGIFIYRIRARSPRGEIQQELAKCAVAR